MGLWEVLDKGHGRTKQDTLKNTRNAGSYSSVYGILDIKKRYVNTFTVPYKVANVHLPKMRGVEVEERKRVRG